MCSIRPSWLADVRCLLVGAVLVFAACENSPPSAPVPAQPKTVDEIAPPAPEPVASKRPSNLDEALNLLPSDERFHGFEMPMGVELHANGRARKIRTTLPRLLRFYYSRYYQVVRTRNGELYEPAKERGRSLKGSDYKIQAADPLKRRAYLHISARPGSTYLLRVEERRARPRVKPDLLRVMEAERRGKDTDVSAAPATTEPPQEVVVPVADGATLVYKRAKPKKLEKFSIRKAKKRALKQRARDGTTRSVSNRIYNWSKQGESRRFLD